ncbi:MAG: hypothetical protein Q7S68_03430 [Deltaproteobacteria bacterium]|nr:hypothetical protein [Deltaproteobacteria bacterium]
MSGTNVNSVTAGVSPEPNNALKGPLRVDHVLEFGFDYELESFLRDGPGDFYIAGPVIVPTYRLLVSKDLIPDSGIGKYVGVVPFASWGVGGLLKASNGGRSFGVALEMSSQAGVDLVGYADETMRMRIGLRGYVEGYGRIVTVAGENDLSLRICGQWMGRGKEIEGGAGLCYDLNGSLEVMPVLISGVIPAL